VQVCEGVDGDEPPRAAREARTVLGREDGRGVVPSTRGWATGAWAPGGGLGLGRAPRLGGSERARGLRGRAGSWGGWAAGFARERPGQAVISLTPAESRSARTTARQRRTACAPVVGSGDPRTRRRRAVADCPGPPLGWADGQLSVRSWPAYPAARWSWVSNRSVSSCSTWAWSHPWRAARLTISWRSGWKRRMK
jgi:hypothetical protein